MTRGGLVFGLYGGLALLGILISAGRGDVDLYRLHSEFSWWMLVLSPLIGLLLGLFVVWLSRLATKKLMWARRLHQEFRHILGPLTNKEILLLALASSIGEELLFRGALQPWIGLWPQALIFALLHIGPGIRFLPWTISAFVLGALFGVLYSELGDLGAPIVAHFTINFINLHFISKTDLSSDDDLSPKEEPSTLALE